jgi:hypothetical protein
MEVDSPNWHEYENAQGFRWLAMQPTEVKVHVNESLVVVQFADDQARAGLQTVMSHRAFREFVMTVAKARETLEAKLEEHDD